MPDTTIAAAKEADGILHGAIDGAAIPASYRAPMTGLRRALDAYASVRPSISYPGVASLHRDVDLVVVRETTEGLYSKIEYTIGPDVACTVRTVTRAGIERVTKRAFELAARRRKSVTVAHKLAGLPVADAFMLEVVRGVAKKYPEIELREANVDALCQDLIQRPYEFDVVLAENQYGDILSDVAAAVAGGLGLAASGCVGDRWAYFEPVHGTAPDIVGRGLANPSAMVLAAALMLDHIGESDAARVVRTAVTEVLADGRTLTADLGGSASTNRSSPPRWSHRWAAPKSCEFTPTERQANEHHLPLVPVGDDPGASGQHVRLPRFPDRARRRGHLLSAPEPGRVHAGCGRREPPALKETVDALTASGVQRIVMGGVPIGAALGRERAVGILEDIAKWSGVQASSSFEDHLLAFSALGVKKVAVANRWPEAVNSGVTKYLEDSGFEVSASRFGGGTLQENKKKTPQGDHETALELGRAVVADNPDAEVLMLPGGNGYFLYAAPLLEQELGIPVVTNHTASLFAALSEFDGPLVVKPDRRWGRLLQGLS